MNLRKSPISKSDKIRVGITIGDPSGVGPQATFKALQTLKGAADFIVIGDAYLLKGLTAAKVIDLNNINRKTFTRGVVRAEYGRACMQYLDKAMDMLKNRQIDALVTAPISKEAINKAGFNYGGHTEYLLKKSGRDEVVMMLLNKYFRFSLITRHIALRNVSTALSIDKVVDNILLTHRSLVNLFGLKSPRLVICGLNPHASDNGLIGNEENKVIKPALAKLKNRFNITCAGPISADAAIAQAKASKYDCVFAIYHDQALIPLKLTSFDSGVNMTLGLPFIRTSPLHGTGFDIAGTPNLINPASMISAINLAIKCALNQRKA
jgi:4-hydroxythreonine-4-phosphate dehydrogenase